MIIEVADRSIEKYFLTGKGSGRYPQEFPGKATRITAVEANSHEGPTWN
jgi:hypothetical protein